MDSLESVDRLQRSMWTGYTGKTSVLYQPKADVRRKKLHWISYRKAKLQHWKTMSWFVMFLVTPFAALNLCRAINILFIPNFSVLNLNTTGIILIDFAIFSK